MSGTSEVKITRGPTGKYAVTGSGFGASGDTAEEAIFRAARLKGFFNPGEEQIRNNHEVGELFEELLGRRKKPWKLEHTTGRVFSHDEVNEAALLREAADWIESEGISLLAVTYSNQYGRDGYHEHIVVLGEKL